MARPSETANPPRAPLDLLVRDATGRSERYGVTDGLTIGRSRSCTVTVEDVGPIDPTHARVEIVADGTAWVRCLEQDRTLTVEGEAARELLLAPGVRFRIGPADFACVPGPLSSPRARERPAPIVEQAAHSRPGSRGGDVIDSSALAAADSTLSDGKDANPGCQRQIRPDDPADMPDEIGDPGYLVLRKVLAMARRGTIFGMLAGIVPWASEGGRGGLVGAGFFAVAFGILGGVMWVGYGLSFRQDGLAPGIKVRYLVGAALGALIGLLLSGDWGFAGILGVLVGDLVAIGWLTLWLRAGTANGCLKRGREIVRWSDLGWIEHDNYDRLDLSVACFTRAIRLHPFYAPAYHARAMALGRKPDWTIDDPPRNRSWVEADLERAVQLEPGSAEYRTSLADFYKESDPGRAMKEYQTAVSNDPGFARARHALGDLHLEHKSFDQAIDEYSQAIQLEPKESSHYQARCAAYEAAGRYEEGIADASELIRLAKSLPTELERRARMYYLVGDHARAKADLAEAIRLVPRLRDYFEERGRAYRAMGERATASEARARSRSKD